MSEAIQLPETLETERLLLRVPRLQDAPAVNAAIQASYPELHEWMDWAVQPQTLEQTQTFCRDARERWLRAEDWPLLMFLRDSETLVGSTGLVRPNWSVPRAEIGYWCHTAHTGRGYVTEVTRALTTFCFEAIGCRRVEIRMDSCNAKSYAVPERLGFKLEALLENDARANDGSLRDTRIYAMFDLAALKTV